VRPLFHNVIWDWAFCDLIAHIWISYLG